MFWDAPTDPEKDKQRQIRGMPPDAVYPTIKPYSQENLASIMADALVGSSLGLDDNDDTKDLIKNLIRKKMSSWRRVIGWTLNDCEPGKFANRRPVRAHAC